MKVPKLTTSHKIEKGKNVSKLKIGANLFHICYFRPENYAPKEEVILLFINVSFYHFNPPIYSFTFFKIVVKQLDFFL